MIVDDVADDLFDDARAVADAVLFEGYALYPYRASSPKNQLRWQFGVLAPRAWSEAGGGDPWWLETQCLIEPAGGTKTKTKATTTQLRARLRFLQLQSRDAAPDGRAPAWDEGKTHEIDLAFAFGSEGGATTEVTSIAVPGGTDSDGAVIRRRWPLAGVVRMAAEPLPGDRPLVRLRVRVENVGAGVSPGAPRDAALRAAFLGTHLLLGVSTGGFVSLMDPPDWAAAAAAACRNVGTYPVLAGHEDRRDLILSAPVILYDHPTVAPESPRDLFDATEIDEILTLRILTLTDGEKREMRATDPRLAALLDSVERLGPEEMARLHGATRELRPVEAPAAQPAPPEEPPQPTQIVVQGATIVAGSRVRLRPGARRSDAQDMFLAGMTATVEAVMRDVEDRDCLAVTIDDDPATEVLRWHGRFHYFYPDEVEPLDPLEAPPTPPRAEAPR
jgi:hypothetical protein